MFKKKTGASIISLALCFVAIACVTTALVAANYNSAMYNAKELDRKSITQVVDSSAYVKVYTIDEVRDVANQAFVDNYLAYHEGKLDLVGLEALVLGDIANKITLEQLDNYAVYVMEDGVDVLYK